MAKEYDPQMRKVMITINNPVTYGFDHDRIKMLCLKSKPTYFCLADEIGTEGTPHTHIYITAESPMRFSTLKRRYPVAHIEAAYGSSAENRDYVCKGGKWADSDKAETCVKGSFYEWGTLPAEEAEKSPKMYQLLVDVEAGKSTAEIIRNNPGYAFKSKEIDLLREVLRSDKFLKENRNVKVHYHYGATGTGKTRGIYERHSKAEICRITYHGRYGELRFDAYHGQKVLVIEEFASQIPIEVLLNLLDIYPLMLPARYNDRVACYDTVYITSNLPLDKQYVMVQQERPETWRAFNRRISSVVEFLADGSKVAHKKELNEDGAKKK